MARDSHSNEKGTQSAGESRETSTNSGHTFEWVAAPDDGALPLGGTPGYTWFNKGDMIAGKYEVLGPLGVGGMGIVYLVRNTHHGKQQKEALKIIHPRHLEDEEALRLFEEEVDKCRKLKSDNIVTVYDIHRLPNGNPFITMEYIDGKTLATEIKERRKAGRPFELKECLDIMKPVLLALQEAHAKELVHRDLKPENIMLVRRGQDLHVKVLDFGISKSLSHTEFSRTSGGLGTAFYIAPEQVSGSEEVTHRADLYSVGVILYELLTGRLPLGIFPAPGKIRPELPEEIDRVIASALSNSPAGRFESAGNMLEALDFSRSPRVQEPIPPMVEIPAGNVGYVAGLKFRLDPFRIDRKLITYGHFSAFAEMVERLNSQTPVNGLILERIWTPKGLEWYTLSGRLSFAGPIEVNWHRPVDLITWYEAAAFCNWRSIVEFDPDIFALRDLRQLSERLDHLLHYNQEGLVKDGPRLGFRLPTEFELAAARPYITPEAHFEHTTSNYMSFSQLKRYMNHRHPVPVDETPQMLIVDPGKQRKEVGRGDVSNFRPGFRCVLTGGAM